MKAANNLYKALYFTAVSLWGYSVLKDENYLPPSLFGNGDLVNLN